MPNRLQSSETDEKKVPNPDGSKGAPDHQAKVDELADKARAEAKPGETVEVNKKVQGVDSTRRPDVQIRDSSGKTRKIDEAERHPNSKRNKSREAEYDKHGIPHKHIHFNNMPDITLYLTEDDEMRFVRFVLQEGAWLVPDSDYEEPSAIRIHSLREYALHRRKLIRKFFIQKEEFVRSSFEFRKIIKNGRPIFYIGQRKGGPNIDFSAGGIFEKEGFKYIRPGECGYYPTYWNTLLSKNQAVPAELRAFYSQVKRFLLQDSSRLLMTKAKIWVLPFARLAMQNGAKLVGFENHTISDLDIGKNGHSIQRRKVHLRKL
jgi:hypothetical protein